MIVTLNGKKVKPVKDRTDGILFIQKQRKYPGQKWEVKHSSKVVFKWHMEAVVANNVSG